MTAMLARVPLLRLMRTPRSWLPILGWAAVAMIAALYLRTRGSTTGADHVMRGAFGVIVLPLAAYGVVGAAFGTKGLRRSIEGVVGLGAAPGRAALASVIVAVLASMVVGGVLASATCAVAHGASDPPLGKDLVASTWIGALGGGAYAAFYSVGAAIGKGTTRSVLVAVDWIIGASGGVGAALVPRGHVLSLLGGAMPAELPQRASSAILVVMVLGFSAVAVALARRP